MKLNSLAFRLFATAALWTVVVLPIAGLIIFSLIRNHILNGFDGQLKTYVWVVQAESLGDGATPARPTNIGEPLFGVTNSGWYWQVKPLGKGVGATLVSDSLATSTLSSPYEHSAVRDGGGFRWLDIRGPLNQPLRIVERVGRLGGDDDGPLYSFIVAGPLDWPGTTISNFGLVLAVSLAVAGLGLLAATYLQVRFGLAPLRKVEQGLGDVRSGKAEQLESELPAEIEPLQIELNQLIAANQEIIERARTQVGNLAHALKTPLAVIVNEAEARETTFSRKVTEQAELMRNQVTLYLDRARMVARVGTIGRVTDVRPVAEALQRTLERIHRAKGVDITLVCPENVRFQGEQQDLEEMIGNLLDNASKWCEHRVRLKISVAQAALPSTSHVLRLEVDDDGPGLSKSERSKIGRRGVRLDETKPGSGLGLSIVGDLVSSYRGTFTLEVSDLGGLRAIVELPATQHRADEKQA